MSVRFTVLPADLVEGDVVRDLNGHTVQEVILDNPSGVYGAEFVAVHTIGPSGRLHTWQCDPSQRLTVMDW